MSESKIFLPVPAELKARWVRLSRERGMKLTDWVIQMIEDRVVIGSLKPPLERMAVYAGLGRKTICNPAYLGSSANGQQVRSLMGQRLAFLRFHGFMFDLSDEQVQRLHKAVRAESAAQSEKFVDLSMIEDAAAYQLCLRGADAFDSDAVAEEIVGSFEHWRGLAEGFPEIDSELLIDRAVGLMR